MSVSEALRLLTFCQEDARVWGVLDATLRQRGERIDAPDLQIAATAIVNDLELVTGNLRHFERVPGLRLSCAFAELR